MVTILKLSFVFFTFIVTSATTFSIKGPDLLNRNSLADGLEISVIHLNDFHARDRTVGDEKMLAIVLLVALTVSVSCAPSKQLLELSIIHLNDFHAKFDETSPSSATCKGENCIGGFARIYSKAMELWTRPNAVMLNAGDNFQGTLYYNLFKWNITQYFMNMLPFDAYTLGNHEFDNGIAGVVPFIKSVKSPTVVCNIDDSLEPTIQHTYNKSTVIVRDGKKIGIIGVILSTTNEIASTENLKFLDELESINKEAERLVEEEDIFTIIVLSHCGYSVDQEVAKKVHPKVGLIVGAHSHSLLYVGEPPNSEYVAGPYPTVIQSEEGNNVLIVQASAYTKYLGNITVFYDENGVPARWEGLPLYIDHNVEPNPEIVEKLRPWKAEVEEFGNRVLGQTLTDLSIGGCYKGECTLGDFVTDAMVASWKDYDEKEEDAWTYVTLATMNSGGLRAVIEAGNITYNDIVTAQPFENTFDCGELQGKYIREFLEFATKPYRNQRAASDIYIPQISGIKVLFNMTQPYGSRVQSLHVKCQNCPEPVFESIDDEKMYRIVVPSFLVGGGDGFVAISEHIQNVKKGPVDIDYYEEYLPSASPLNYTIEGRITVVGLGNISSVNDSK